MSSSDNGLTYGDEVLIPWGLDETRGTVQEIYGPPGRRHVVVLLDPQTSAVVDEPTTISMPVSAVRKAPSVV